MRPELIGNPRRQILHGGVISAVLDVAAGFAATGRVVRLGARMAVAHTEMENDAGELIATGGAAYMAG